MLRTITCQVEGNANELQVLLNELAFAL